MIRNKGNIFAITSIISLLISSCSNVTTSANIKLECPKIETNIANLKSIGNLILHPQGDGSYQINMATMVMTQMNKPNEALTEFSVSPNGKWIAYDDSELDKNMSYLFHNLIVAGVNNQIYKTLPWESEWGSFRWLDNEQLIIRTIPQSEPNSIINYNPDFLVLNLFTGERQIVKVDYPNIYNLSPMVGFLGVSAYNLTLTRVVYLEGGVSGPFYYVLWDIQHKSQITNFQISDDLNAIPRWSLDGKQFAFAPSLVSKIKEYPSYELFSVTEAGDIKQLTHLTDYYPWVYIEDLSWSPDSRYIAFWFTHWQQSEQPYYATLGDRYLAVLDTTTDLVTSYCINGENNATIGIRKYLAPLWSPDSKQIVVQSQVGDDSLNFQTILIDIQRNRAFHIGDNLEPEGWMISP
jgi:dipeptidyl aminopeptidase/acylaminoacyl peptidase